MHIYTYVDIFICDFLFFTNIVSYYTYCIITCFHLIYIVNISVYSLKKLYRYYMLFVKKSEITDMQKENTIAPNLTSQREMLASCRETVFLIL